MSEQIEEKAEKLVEDVEQPLRKRKREAVKEAKKAEKQDVDTTTVPFRTPTVVGGEHNENEYRTDSIEFFLSDDLPNGRSSITVSMPSKDNILDDSHKLNRLLSLYNIDVDRIGDINNNRLPIIPVGDYDDPEQMDYKVDYPPVPTVPNMLMYKARRLAIRSKLLKLRKTPQISRDFFGDIDECRYESRDKVPVMTVSAHPYFELFDIEDSTNHLMLTDRGVASLYLTGLLLPLFILYSLFGLGILTVLIWVTLAALLTGAHMRFVSKMLGRMTTSVKDRFFPNAED